MLKKLFLLLITGATLLTVGWRLPQTAVNPPTNVNANTVSCIEPATNPEQCAAQEAQILASIVRIVFHGDYQVRQPVDFTGSVSHGTVMDGRYLVTHNHFGFDIAILSPGNNQGIAGFSLYRGSGERIVRDAPVDTFTAVRQDAQTLLLDFGPDYFTNLDVPSAGFLSAEDVQVPVGAEVAQLDWDGERSYIVWTNVIRIATEDGAPYLMMNHYGVQGASGGGVFWQGQHVANMWAHGRIIDPDTGAFVRAYSMAALNSEAVLE